MSISQPDFLMVFNENTGSSITNYGANAGHYAVASQATLGTDYTWHPGSGIYGAQDGYINTLTNSGPTMPYFSTAATGPGTAMQAINFAIGFRIHSAVAISGVYTVFASSTVPTAGGDAYAAAIPPAGSGSFDMNFTFTNTSGSNNITFTNVTALAFDTDYILSMSLDPSTIASTQGSLKFGSNTAQQPATVNWSTTALNTNYASFLRRYDFTDYFGLNGRVYFIAYQRGGTAWNTTDLANINAAPQTAFATWWPSPPAVQVPYMNYGLPPLLAS